MKYEKLRITEIFHSIQGESVHTGLPTAFVRLTGCPLRCQYCDTAYAFKGGTQISIDDIIHTVAAFGVKYVCVTGGEPLAQPGCLTLMTRLADHDFNVSIETSGALDISAIDPRVMIIMDIKTPDSLEADKNLYSNFAALKLTDQIKFVICSREDYLWSCNLIKEYNLTDKAQILFSPCYNQVNPTSLANWIIEDKLNVRFQIQLHKLLWDDEPGR